MDCIKKTKLLIGITLSEIGGSQKVVFDLIANLPEEEYDITLVTSPGGELINWVENLNNKRNSKIHIIALHCLKHEISIWNDIKTIINLYILIKKGNFDIAHFHTTKIGLIGTLAARFAGVPKIFYTVHGWGASRHLKRIWRVLQVAAECLIGKLCSKVICVCHNDMEEGIRKGWIRKENADVIYNGISTYNYENGRIIREKWGISEETVIGTIMRLKAPKDPLFTIKVMNELKIRGCNVKLIIIGDGILRTECQNLINELKLEQHVYLLGSRTDVRDLLHFIDVIVLFSMSEGLPIAIIEALFAGKPIVASKVGGMDELVEHGENGYLIDDFDIDTAATYIEQIVRDKRLREYIGERSKKTAHKNFLLENMIKSYRKLYLDNEFDSVYCHTA